MLNAPMLSALREAVEQQVRGVHFSLAGVADTLRFDPGPLVYRALCGWPPALSLLASLGFPAPWWSGGAVIPKPSGERCRGWHQDWWAWQCAEALAEIPPQVGLLYYLHDTTAETGALKVLAGSHRAASPLHSRYFSDARVHDEPQPGEEAVCVRAGDVVVLDARLLHSSYPHAGTQRRDLLTLWYLPRPDLLSPALLAYVQRSQPPLLELLGPLAPSYDGEAEPVRQCCFPRWCPEYAENA